MNKTKALFFTYKYDVNFRMVVIKNLSLMPSASYYSTMCMALKTSNHTARNILQFFWHKKFPQ